MNGDRERELDLLAAEYALGSLSGEERQRVEMRLLADADLRRRVEAWQRLLAPLAEAVEPVDPPARVLVDVQRALEVVAPEPRAIRPRRERGGRVRWRRSLAVWRAATAVATAAAVALAIHVGRDAMRPAPERYVAVLEAEGDRPAWLVTVDIVDGELVVRPVAPEPQAGRSFELWLLPGGEAAPRSLGVLDAAAPIRRNLTIPIAAERPEQAAVAVSLEPAGGSPTGAPTGPVLYSAPLLKQTP